MNDDLIRRQAAIDALQKEINKDIPPFDVVIGSIRCGVRLARNIIEDLPTADVVEVDEAQKEIDYWHDKAQSYEQTILKLSLNKADVVEVVRCKDCKYGEVDDADFPNQYLCHHHGSDWNEGNHYCSFGERKEE